MSLEIPGFARVEADLTSAGLAGIPISLSPAEIVTVLGEVGRLREQHRDAVRVVQTVESGRDCWAAQQGYETCEIRGAGKFLAGEPKRRPWWRLGR